ncbi:MAG: type II toxin-antitoxin system VapC family toxin [Terracidiphilus sp.]
MPVVLDASVVAAWAFSDERNESAKEILFKVRKEGAVAPVLLWYEIRNALVIAEWRGRILPEESDNFLADLENLPIEIDDCDYRNIVRLARVYKLAVYDATYLEIALRRSLFLATIDNKLAQAAKATGVGVIPR